MYQLTTSEAFNQNIKSLYFITPYIKALSTFTKCDSNTHTIKSSSRRLLFEKRSITCSTYICLCGRSTGQVPAGVLDTCGILTVNNINKNSNNYYDNNNSKIISYSGDRLTRLHMLIPPPTNSAKYGAYSAYFISVPVHVLELQHSQICVGICIAQNFEYKSANYMAIDLEYTPCSWKNFVYTFQGAAGALV